MHYEHEQLRIPRASAAAVPVVPNKEKQLFISKSFNSFRSSGASKKQENEHRNSGKNTPEIIQFMQ